MQMWRPSKTMLGSSASPTTSPGSSVSPTPSAGSSASPTTSLEIHISPSASSFQLILFSFFSLAYLLQLTIFNLLSSAYYLQLIVFSLLCLSCSRQVWGGAVDFTTRLSLMSEVDNLVMFVAFCFVMG